MDKKDSPVYEQLEDITADNVTITQGGAGHIEANTVEITQGGVQAVEAQNVTISQGGAFIIESSSADLTLSGVGLLTGDTVSLHSGGAGLVVADTVKAESGSIIGFLFAGTIEGSPNVRFDARTAAAFGAGLGIALLVLRRLLGHR